jgi:SAM-dependent methyltransferase
MPDQYEQPFMNTRSRGADMTTVANTAQAEAWNGYEGSHWAEHRDRYDAVNSGFNGQLLSAAAIGHCDRVLDVGCGTGQITRLAARMAPRGSALGVDLSAPMLARARAVCAEQGIANASFEQGDAQVHPLPAAGFDVVVSRFGIMFFGDAVAAFANLGRSMRPGGRLAVLAMRRLADHDLGTVLEAAAAYLPALGVSGGGGPDSFDPSALDAAGFADVEVAPVDAPQVWGSDAADAGAFFAEWGPVRHHLGLAGPEAAAAARAAIIQAMRRYERPGAVELRGAAWLITAERP